jgi:hypothetical protein
MKPTPCRSCSFRRRKHTPERFLPEATESIVDCDQRQTLALAEQKLGGRDDFHGRLLAALFGYMTSAAFRQPQPGARKAAAPERRCERLWSFQNPPRVRSNSRGRKYWWPPLGLGVNSPKYTRLPVS